MDKKTNFKETMSSLKEAWKDPRKKAGIKLLSYFIFFFILMLFAFIVNNFKTYDNVENKTKTTTTTIKVDKYFDKQKKLLTDKYNVSYVINAGEVEYKINGTLENNIVNGYLESNDGIKKIIFKDNILYEIVNEEEVILESDINNNYISLNYIINLIKQNSGLINDNDDMKVYSYNISEINTKISVISDDSNINEINIENNDEKYQLNFDK